tara:strand:+ start:88 stop:420 length:333 start_codon:yes stop_codon:yes gene_type:complete
MSVLGGRRTLGPINTEMGGDPNPSGSAGGGGSTTIENNVDGYMIKATGQSDKISGVEEFQFDGAALKAQADLQVSGSGNNLFIQGSDSEGNLNRMFRIEVSGGIFKAVPI